MGATRSRFRSGKKTDIESWTMPAGLCRNRWCFRVGHGCVCPLHGSKTIAFRISIGVGVFRNLLYHGVQMTSFNKIDGVIALIDVNYSGQTAKGACVTANSWNDAAPIHGHVIHCEVESAYIPGEFYRRELPVIVQLLSELIMPIRTIVVDGHAWLEPGRPGLGVRLYMELQEQIPVIGVAKSSFKDSTCAIKVFRGGSSRPLFVTACGVDPEFAADWIKSMHGSYRIPTLLQKADRLSRAGV